MQGVNPKLAESIAQVESGLRPTVKAHEKKVGGYSYGLFQVRYRTAQDLGFAGTKEELMGLETNIYYGVKYLAACQKKFGEDIGAISCCYNAGIFRKDKVCHSGQVRKYKQKILKLMTVDRNRKIWYN
jgi:soluble lytic murein transglycosylase-like protein